MVETINNTLRCHNTVKIELKQKKLRAIYNQEKNLSNISPGLYCLHYYAI
jgi:hypothetical protein